MEEEADRLEEHSDQVGDRIDEAKRDWEHKENDPSVPGAQPQESDQMPEEGPAGQVPDDTGARDESDESPGAADEEGTATGNPNAAGSDE